MPFQALRRLFPWLSICFHLLLDSILVVLVVDKHDYQPVFEKMSPCYLANGLFRRKEYRSRESGGNQVQVIKICGNSFPYFVVNVTSLRSHLGNGCGILDVA